MTSFQRFPIVAGGVFLLCAAANAQSVISARAGLINYTEGDVFLQNKPVESSIVKFQEMKDGDQLRTQEGRAEVLLTPGVVLRMAENSGIQMISGKLSHTRLEVLTGSVIVEAADVSPTTEVTLLVKDTSVEFTKTGVVRIDTDPASVKVFHGEVVVAKKDQSLTLKEGKQTLVAGVLAPEPFDKVGDSFYRWAFRRSESLSAANVSAAASVRKQEYLNNGGGNSWYFNSLLGMYTFVPGGRGTLMSPFGFAYFSPYSVGDYLYGGYWGGGSNYYTGYYGGTTRGPARGGNSNALSYNPSLGYNTGSRAALYSSSNGASSSSYTPSSSVTASSPSTGAARGGDSGVGRGSGGSAGRGGR